MDTNKDGRLDRKEFKYAITKENNALFKMQDIYCQNTRNIMSEKKNIVRLNEARLKQLIKESVMDEVNKKN